MTPISENFEIVMVNDASPDESWKIIQDLAERDPRVKGINLSRNFGQHQAFAAGLDHAHGDWMVVMDCDLQDQPEEIPKLYAKAREGFDLVVGTRARRQDTLMKKLGSRLFYLMFNFLAGATVSHGIGNFGIYSRRVIRSIRALTEQNRSFGLFALWVGFRRVEIEVQHAQRPRGTSSYTFMRMLNLAVDSTLAHSTSLLRTSAKLGFLLSFWSLLYGTWLMIRYFAFATPVEGWTSVMVSIYLTTGLIIGSIRVTGLYVGKIFDEVKRRPLYIVESMTFELGADGH